MAKLKYRLGLDLGTTSLGWAIVRLDQFGQPCAVVKTGVRIFSDGRHPKTGASLAVDRRNARQSRRRRDRLLKRKRRFIEGLTRFGLMPADPDQQRQLVLKCPYELRASALHKRLEPYEIGRAFFHLNQRRGFKSNRKTDGRDNESSVMKAAIRQSREKISEAGCLTLGEWLYKRHKSGEPVRARLHGKTVKEKRYDLYVDRDMVLSEFDLIWRKQQAYHSDLLTEEARSYLYDTLQFQRELLPILPGRCTLIPDEERAPLALPLVQKFRIMQELNNLRVIDKQLHSRPLSINERNELFGLLSSKKDVKFETLAKKIGLSHSETFNLQDVKRDRLKGDLTSAVIGSKKLLGKRWYELDDMMKMEVTVRLLNEVSESALVKWLIDNLDITEETALQLANASLPDGYGRLSLRALEQIVPALERAVIPYSEAVEKCGLGSHSHLSMTAKTGEVLSNLPYYGIVLQRHVAFAAANPVNEEQRYGKVANPTVHIALNQVRIVVNAIIKKYGLPEQVNIEVTRELKQSVEQRRRQQNDQAARQKKNSEWLKEACEVLGLLPENLKGTQRRKIIEKMRLWDELRTADSNIAICPFSGEQISLTRLLGSSIEVEHILPFSRTLDDSLANKTLASTHANRIKTNLTPYEAFGENMHVGFDYQEILLRASSLPKNKSWRFGAEAMERFSEENAFLDRALNDTSYISRLARDYVACICLPHNVLAIPGRLTGLLRGKFGFNKILSGNASKNRDDHRHHAIDALVVVLTDRSLLQRVATANRRTRSLGLDRLIDDMPLPFESVLSQAQRSISSIIVSHRPDHGYQAQMHEDTAWCPLPDGYAKKRVRDDETQERKAVVERKKLVKIVESGLERHGLNDDGSPKPYKGYVGGSNYSLEIFVDENGKWKGQTVSTFQAYQCIREHGESEGLAILRNPERSITGRPLQLRLMINDSINLSVDGQRGVYRVATIASSGRVELALHNEANVDYRNRNETDFSYVRRSASTLQKAGAFSVTVSPLGKVRKIKLHRCN